MGWDNPACTLHISMGPTVFGCLIHPINEKSNCVGDATAEFSMVNNMVRKELLPLIFPQRMEIVLSKFIN